MPFRLRSVLVPVALLVLAATLTACGGGSSVSADTDVNELLTKTFSGQKKIESGRLDFTVRIDAPGAAGAQGGPVDVKLSGPFQSQGEQRLPKLDLDVAFSGQGQNIKAGVISTGDRGFVNFNNTDYAVSDQVFKQFQAGYEQAQKEAAKQQGDQKTSLATLGIDPRKWLTNPKNEGEVKVGAADTVRITGGVDVPKLLDDVNVALERATQLGLQGAGQVPQKLTDQQRQQIVDAVKDLRVEIFTGKEDTILRRMIIDLKAAAPASSGGAAQDVAAKLDFSLTGLNEDQEIVAPAQTKPFDELLGQLGSLGGGLGGASGGSSGGSGSSADKEKLEAYTKCITDAGADQAKAQKCAELLGG